MQKVVTNKIQNLSFLKLPLRFVLYTANEVKGAKMRVLIVEDNAFNAYCLRRLLESVLIPVDVTLVNHSQAALAFVESNEPDVVIIDGDLAVSDGINCNGPALADMLLAKYPYLPLIAWTNSELMRDAFAQTFKQHKKPFNEHNNWSKVTTAERICRAWNYFFADSVIIQDKVFAYRSNKEARC